MEQEINGKVQKISEEDYEIIKIIETETYPRAVRWYQESYGCDLVEAVKAIGTIKRKYSVDHVGLYANLDKEDIIFLHDILHDISKLIGNKTLNLSEVNSDLFEMELDDWICLKTGWTKDKAVNATSEGFDEWAKRTPDKANSGCIITLLIAITSTLSVFFML